MERVTDLNYWMDSYLKSNLNTIAYNVCNDFDAVIPVTGSGMVRVGKTVLAGQAAHYLAYKLKTPFGINNFVWSGDELIKKAKELPKNSVFLYDESRAEIDNKKLWQEKTRRLLDFFTECGMYNHVIVLVMPDFFEFPKSIAMSRSELLLNVIRTTKETKDKDGEEVIKFDRGVFEFFNRTGKKLFYINGKKNNDDYDLSKKYRSFFGEFPNTWVVDRVGYEKLKLKHIQRDRDTYAKDLRFAIALKSLCGHISQTKAVEELKKNGLTLTQQRISQLVRIADNIERIG